MKTGRSLTEVATEIERQTASKKDLVADTRNMTMLDDGKTVAIENHGAYPMTDLALTQVGERTGIPTKYLRRMQTEAPALLASNVNHWFREDPKPRMVRTLDGNIRAFLSNAYQRVDNYDVAKVVLPILHGIPGVRMLSTELTPSRLYIKISSSAVTREIKSRRVGDMVEAGVMISNSEVGLGAVSITPFALFLACLNGQVRDGGKRWNHIGRRADESENPYVLLSDETKQADDKALLLKARDTVTSALNPEIFERWIAKVQATTEQRIEGDVPRAVEVMSNTLTLSQDEQSGVLRHLIESGDLSRFGLMQAVTRSAEDAKSYDRASELEALGGRVLDLAPSEWNQIRLAA